MVGRSNRAVVNGLTFEQRDRVVNTSSRSYQGPFTSSGASGEVEAGEEQGPSGFGVSLIRDIQDSCVHPDKKGVCRGESDVWGCYIAGVFDRR